MYVSNRGSLFAYLFFKIMCTLHQNIPFYVLFPFKCFKQCFTKVFTIFIHDLKFENYSLEYMKPRSCFFSIGGKSEEKTFQKEPITNTKIYFEFFMIL